MRKPATLLAAILSCGLFYHAQAQTQFWSDNFEDAGAPSSGVRTPSVENSFGSPATRYFFRTTVAGIAQQNGPYTNVQGSKIWAAEDIDAALTGSNFGQSSNQNITWSGINIAGKSGISFKGLLAANNVGGANWEGTNFGVDQDFIIIEYRIDNGAWNKIIGFYSNAVLNGSLSQDTNNDLIGDGTALSAAFAEFTANIPGTGNLLDLRFNCFVNGATTEELAIDNFRLFETVPLPVGILSFEAIQDHNNAVLNWRVPGNTTQKNFTIERSADGKTFYTLGNVQEHAGAYNSDGNIAYRFTDAKPLNGKNFYRIAQKGADGITTYSVIRFLQWGITDSFILFPNPAGDELNLSIHTATAPSVQISIMDISGKLLIQETKALEAGMGKYRLSLAAFPAGSYHIIITNQENVLFRSRVVRK